MFLGIISANFIIRIVVGSSLILSIADKNLRSMIGIFLGILCSWIGFYLTIYLYRKVLVSIGIMTKDESNKPPFHVGYESKE